MAEIESLEGWLEEIAKRNPGKSKPGGYYSKSGDCFFYYIENVKHYAQRVDDLLTVYRAEGDDRVVGVEIKAVSRLPKHDVIGVKVQRVKEVTVVSLLLGTFLQAPQPHERTKTEQKAAYWDAASALKSATVPSEEWELVGSN